MSDDDMPNTSADQDAWVALATSIRSELVKVAPLMGAMRPDEVKAVVEGAGAAIWLHFRANTFDKQVELQQNRPCTGG